MERAPVLGSPLGFLETRGVQLHTLGGFGDISSFSNWLAWRVFGPGEDGDMRVMAAVHCQDGFNNVAKVCVSR
jgi:hypothetical protein